VASSRGTGWRQTLGRYRDLNALALEIGRTESALSLGLPTIATQISQTLFSCMRGAEITRRSRLKALHIAFRGFR